MREPHPRLSAAGTTRLLAHVSILVGLLVANLYYLLHTTAATYLPSAAFAVFLTSFLLATVHGVINWDAQSVLDRTTALCWGGGYAVLLAFFGERSLYAWLGQAGYAVNSVTNTHLIAPLTEEALKFAGLGLLLMVAARKANPFVLALSIGLGFGTVENIQYFNSALVAHGYNHEFFLLLVSRGLSGPILHATCAGIAGLALRYAFLRRTVGSYTLVPVALSAAAGLHSIANGLFGLVTLNIVETLLGVGVCVVLVRLDRALSSRTTVIA